MKCIKVAVEKVKEVTKFVRERYSKRTIESMLDLQPKNIKDHIKKENKEHA